MNCEAMLAASWSRPTVTSTQPHSHSATSQLLARSHCAAPCRRALRSATSPGKTNAMQLTASMGGK